MIRTTIFIYFFLIINPYLLASTFSNNGVKLSNKNSIYEIAKIPESKISIGQWALIIAKEFNPTVDISLYQKKLNEMAKEIIRMLAGRTKDNYSIIKASIESRNSGIILPGITSSPSYYQKRK